MQESEPAGRREVWLALVWRARPVFAAVLGIALVALPVVASAAAALFVGRLVPAPRDLLGIAARLLAMVAAGTSALVLVERVARRVAPLTVLLKLALVFPGEAPRRFGLALRASSSPTRHAKTIQAKADGASAKPGSASQAQAAADIVTLLARLTAHDRATRGHCERVRAFADLLGEELRLPKPDREKLRWSAVLHDIGKLGVPSHVLSKPGRLSDEEWGVMKAHPEIGAQIVHPIEAFLGGWARAVAEHHERWDGSGYPLGIEGDGISFGARIVAVADSFEAMTAVRSYSRPKPAAAARQELVSNSGSQFDPRVVRAFLSISLPRIKKAIGPVGVLAQLPFSGSLSRVQALAVSGGRGLVLAAGSAVTAGALVAAGVAPLGSSGPAAGSALTVGPQRSFAGHVPGGLTSIPRAGKPPGGVKLSIDARRPPGGSPAYMSEPLVHAASGASSGEVGFRQGSPPGSTPGASHGSSPSPQPNPTSAPPPQPPRQPGPVAPPPSSPAPPSPRPPPGACAFQVTGDAQAPGLTSVCGIIAEQLRRLRDHEDVRSWLQ